MKIASHLWRRILVSGTVFWISLVAASRYIRPEQSGSLRILLSLAPVIPGIFFLLSIGAAINRLDELQRKIQVEALAVSFAGTALVAFSYGLLGLAGVKQANWIFVPLVMAVFWLAGKLWTMWRYR